MSERKKKSPEKPRRRPAEPGKSPQPETWRGGSQPDESPPMRRAPGREPEERRRPDRERDRERDRDRDLRDEELHTRVREAGH